MKKTLIALTLAGVALGSVSAQAFQANRAGKFYISPTIGGIFYDSNRNLDNSFVANVGFGYNFTNLFALQAVLGSQNPSRVHGGGHATGYLFRVEGVLNFDTGTRFVPYAAAGIGRNKIESSNFLFDPGLGVHYYIGPGVSLDLNYRRLIDIAGDRQDNMYTIGATFMFGGTSSNYAAQPAIPAKKLNPVQKKVLKKAKKKLQYVLPDGVKQCNPAAGITPKQGCVKFNGNELTMLLDVKFLQNRAGIRSQFHQPINRLAAFLKQYKSTSAKLLGYASSEGPLSFNQTLSQTRADKVKGYLVKQGVAPSRLQSVGEGIRNPLEPNTTEAGREANRRVMAAVSVNIKA